MPWPCVGFCSDGEVVGLSRQGFWLRVERSKLWQTGVIKRLADPDDVWVPLSNFGNTKPRQSRDCNRTCLMMKIQGLFR